MLNHHVCWMNHYLYPFMLAKHIIVHPFFLEVNATMGPGDPKQHNLVHQLGKPRGSAARLGPKNPGLLNLGISGQGLRPKDPLEF